MIGGEIDRKRVQDEAFFREMFPGFPDERTYTLLATAAANPHANNKELKSIMRKKCRNLSQSQNDQA